MPNDAVSRPRIVSPADVEWEEVTETFEMSPSVFRASTGLHNASAEVVLSAPPARANERSKPIMDALSNARSAERLHPAWRWRRGARQE